MVCTGGNTSGCDVATIYVIGDVNTLSEIFIGLATMFGSPEWATNDGWGVGANIGLAMTFALLVVGFKTIITQKMDLHYMLASLIIFNVFFVPTMPVQVVDYASGRNSGTITGVPIGIGMVGYAGSTLSYRLTEEISENFSGLDGNGNYSTPFVTGFLDPLVQTLMMRKMSFNMLDINLDATLTSYYANCVVPSISDGVYSESVMESHADPITGYHFNISNINNYLMEFYPSTGEKYLTTCHEAIPAIRGWLDTVSESEKSKAIQKTLFTNNGTGDKYSFDTYSEAVKAILGYQHNTSEFMYRTMLVNHTALAKKFAAEDLADARAYSMVVTDAVERERIDAAAEATVFLNFMQPLMTVLQFIFYAASPIMALIMVASPAGGLVKAGMYVLFGIWAHSWMPFAAIVNAYIQNSIAHAITDGTDITALNVTLNQIPGFYNLVANKLAAASNIMGAVPIVSGALLMGSPFAMAQLGQRFASGGKVESGTMAPEMVSSAPVAQGGSRYAESSGDLAYSTGVSYTSAQRSSSIDVSSNDVSARSTQVANENVKSAQANVSKAAQNMLSAGVKNNNSIVASNGESASVTNAFLETVGQRLRDTTGYNFTNAQVEQFMSSIGQNEAFTKALFGGFSANYGGANAGGSLQKAWTETEGIASNENSTFQEMWNAVKELTGEEGFTSEVATKFDQTLSKNNAHNNETSAASQSLSSSKAELNDALTYQQKTSDLNSSAEDARFKQGGNLADVIQNLSRSGAVDPGRMVSKFTGGEQGIVFEDTADKISNVMPDSFGKTGPESRLLQLANASARLLQMDDDQIRSLEGNQNMSDSQIDSIREKAADNLNSIFNSMGSNKEVGSFAKESTDDNNSGSQQIKDEVKSGQISAAQQVSENNQQVSTKFNNEAQKTKSAQGEISSNIGKVDEATSNEGISSHSSQGPKEAAISKAKNALGVMGKRGDSEGVGVLNNDDLTWFSSGSDKGKVSEFVSSMGTPGSSVPYKVEERTSPTTWSKDPSVYSRGGERTMPISENTKFASTVVPIDEGESGYTQTIKGASNFYSSVVDHFNSESGEGEKKVGRAQSAANKQLGGLQELGLISKDEHGLLLTIDSMQEIGKRNESLSMGDKYLSEKYGEAYNGFLKQNDVSSLNEYVQKNGNSEASIGTLDAILEVRSFGQSSNEVPVNIVDKAQDVRGEVEGIFNQSASGNPRNVK